MSGRFPGSCMLGMEEETLSAWRDGLLAAEEQRGLAAHIGGCGACQARLAAFDGLARTLRGRRPPEMQALVWRGLQTRMMGERHGTMRRGGRTARTTLMASAAAVLLVALFAGILVTHGGNGARPGSGSTLTPTAGKTATPSPTHTAPSPTTTEGIPAGWTKANIGEGSIPKMALAPSDPHTTYACNISAKGIGVSATRDGGATWQSLGTPLQGQFCILSVNPTNANDIVLNDGGTYGMHMVRSLNGGAHWHAQRGAELSYTGEGWIGSSLYVTTTLADGGSPLSHLYVSQNGGPFIQLDKDGKLGNTFFGDSGAVLLITGQNATILLQLQQATLESTDGGRTWSVVTLKDGANSVRVSAASPDGQTLIGTYASTPSQTAISHDEGKTWQKLPAAPSGVPNFGNLWVTPDGTLYATSSNLNMVSGDDRSFYELAPGGSRWSVALQLPANTFPDAVGWEGAGHPTTLWATYSSDARGSSWALISHTLGG